MRSIVSIKKTIFLATICTVTCVLSCTKEVEIGKDPYEGGKEPLGVAFTKAYSDPELAEPGAEVTYFVKGLKQYEGQFDFTINDVPVVVKSLSDSTIQVIVPELISSGTAKIKMKDQLFYGPRLLIEGNVSVDNNFDVVNGFNGGVNTILSHSGGYLIGGFFTNYENEASSTVFRNGIHFINSLGKTGTGFEFRKGFDGVVSDIKRQNNMFVVGGSFSKFHNRSLNNLVRLNADGKIDSVVVELLNSTDKPENGLDTVSALNAGTMGGIGGGTVQGGSVRRVFTVADNKIVAIGGFHYHTRVDYRYSSRDQKREVLTPARHIMRITSDGTLDSAFNYSNVGANGEITDAVKLSGDNIVVVGSFTSYNQKAVPRIMKIDATGKVDAGFAVGTGANDAIFSIQYNENRKKMIITGRFTSFNGQPAKGVVVLNEDGSLDPTFKLKDIGESFFYYGYILNSGKVLLSGSVDKYDGVKRSNLLILNADGTAEQKYNNIGLFGGMVNTVVETTSSLGHPAILLGGAIGVVEKKIISGIVKLEIKD